MDKTKHIRDAVEAGVRGHSRLLKSVARELYEHPEVGYEESESTRMLTGILEREGFEVQQGVGGMSTSFVARKRGGRRGPVIAFLCEYDALPEIGHACGHNLIAAIGLGAGLGLKSAIEETGLEVRVVGCPAEEGAVDNAGGKVRLIEAGAFRDVDAALMAHPATRTMVHVSSTVRDAIEVSFHGRSAHAAGSMADCINALDALLHLFQFLATMRPRLPDGALIHGIISHGGVAPNIIPDLATARFYLRARTLDQVADMVSQLEGCIKGIGTATGARGQWRRFAHRYLDMHTNTALADQLADNLAGLGVEVDRGWQRGSGSTDMGNVSQVVPSVHAYIEICGDEVAGHTRDFARASVSRRALDMAIKAATALALTGVDLATDERLMASVRAEFNNGR